MNMIGGLFPSSKAKDIQFKKNPGNLTGWGVRLSLVALLVAAPFAPVHAAPRDTDCDGGSVGSCVDETLTEQGQILDNAEQLLGDVDNIVNSVRSMGLMSYSRDQYGLEARRVGVPTNLNDRIATLRNEHARAKAANDATTDEEYNDMLDQADKENRKNCKGDSDLIFYQSLEDKNYIPPGYQWVDIGTARINLATENVTYSRQRTLMAIWFL